MSVLDWFRKNSAQFSGQIFLDEPLSKYTYYRIGGPADILAIPKNEEDLHWLAQGMSATGVSGFILGQGSNLLVSDRGFQGLVIRTGKLFLDLEICPGGEGEVGLKTGGSLPLSTLLKRASLEGWSGLEFFAGIPGTVGGAVRMNAGTHLGEVAHALEKVEVRVLDEGSLNWKRLEFLEDQLQFQYRKNLFLPKLCIVKSAEWKIQKTNPAEVKKAIDQVLARRKASQPVDYPSCGSIFKNPKASGFLAWQVIDRLGLRGYRMGNAQFSEKHSNFIINLGKAKATEVLGLIELAKSRAQEELGLTLEEEVITLGF